MIHIQKSIGGKKAISGAVGLILSGVFASNPVLTIIFLSIATLGVIGFMPLFWPLPSAFLAGTDADRSCYYLFVRSKESSRSGWCCNDSELTNR